MALALSYRNNNNNMIKNENNNKKQKETIVTKYNYKKNIYNKIINKFYSLKK